VVDSGNKWKKVIILVVVILIVLMILIAFIVGVKSLLSFFKGLLIALMIVGLVFIVLYVFYLIFIKKEFKDIPATYRKKLHTTAKIMKREMLGDLYLSGDEKHNRITLGKYKYLRIHLPKQEKTEKIVDKKPVLDAITKQPIMDEKTNAVPVDVFIVEKDGVFSSLFSNPLFIICKPEDHDYSAIFNDVTLKGFNLVPLDSQFHTLNHRSLDTDITKGVTTNYMREVVYEIFADLDKMVKQAMNLDSKFQKEKERQMEFEIPSMNPFGQQNK